MNKKIDVVRAWRDEEYRNSLTEEERASLPESPAGLATINDSVLRSVTGGCATMMTLTCWSYCDCNSTRGDSCVEPGELCP